MVTSMVRAASRSRSTPRTGVPSQRRLRAQTYPAKSGMGFVELARKYDYGAFADRIRALPGVKHVEHSEPKQPGNHYVQPRLRKVPHRFIQMELSTHGHRKNTTNCTALHWKPPAGLEGEARRILAAAVAGWELNPPGPTNSEQGHVVPDR